MFRHLAFARSLPGVALAAALTATLMSGCGGDDDATDSQSASTAAAAGEPPAKPTDRGCPFTTGEVSERLGLELRAVQPKGSTKVSCTFRAKADCPCGPTKYAEVDVTVTAGLAESISAQRDDLLRGAGIRDPFNERPDLGKGAFMVKPEGTRGQSATFPSSAGAAVVSVTFGVQDAANRVWVPQDREAAERVISFVVPRMSSS